MSKENVDENIVDLLEVLDLSEDLKIRILEAFNRQSLVDYRKLEVAMDELRSSLNNLRVYIKYQTFDLAATRREKAKLEETIIKLMEEKDGFS